MPVGTSKVLALVLDHVGQSLEGLWRGADAPKDGGGTERHLPRAAPGSQVDGTPGLPSCPHPRVLGQGAGPAQPLWSWDIAAAPICNQWLESCPGALLQTWQKLL